MSCNHIEGTIVIAECRSKDTFTDTGFAKRQLAFTFKNIQGTEITGTNTMYEGVNVEHTDAGDECVVVFEQKMDMQGGEYLLSFGCTGYRNGDFTVFHRLYDACNITVVSSKNTVGFYDMNSKVWIEE